MQIAIVGPGLIGRSIALATQRGSGPKDRGPGLQPGQAPSTQITEIDRGDSLAPLQTADLVVLATPVDVILRTIHDHHDLLRPSVVVDVGSTKRAIVAAARDAGLTGFVGGHPMAGAATSGPAEARADLFDDRPFFLVRGDANARAWDTVQAFVRRLGARPVVATDDGEEHDRIMAAVSHLPQVVASALMVTAAEAAGSHLDWAGSGLRDTTRLAESAPHVWQSILDTNADEVAPLLRAVAAQLEALADHLGDGRSAGELLGAARRARATLRS
jgi:prephenate dehydrogenase